MKKVVKRRLNRKVLRVLIVVIVLVIMLFILNMFKDEVKDNPVMLEVDGYNQFPYYPTGCESASLYMLLKYYNVDVTMEEITEALPKGPLPYEENGKLYGANPEREFVGEPWNANSYGVFNKPIRFTAEKFLSGAKTKNGATINDITRIIKSGNPVIAWYTTDVDKGIEYKYSWLDYETGEKITWPTHEHAVVIYGYDGNNLFYQDPSTGDGVVVNKKTFKKAFDKLGGRIVYYD